MKFNRLNFQHGISLIELVIFIAILSVALTSITLIYINTTRSNSDPLMRIRSVELAQSMLEEILIKSYDENTPLGGGCVSYPVQGNTLCASATNAYHETDLKDEEGGVRTTFDDVDDYHNLAYCGAGGAADTSCTNPCLDMVDESGISIKNEYIGYALCIQVSYAGGASAEINNVTPGTGTDVATNDAKRIDVIVTDPLKSKIKLSAYRLNF